MNEAESSKLNPLKSHPSHPSTHPYLIHSLQYSIFLASPMPHDISLLNVVRLINNLHEVSAHLGPVRPTRRVRPRTDLHRGHASGLRG